MAVPGVVPLLETTGSPPLAEVVDVGAVESFPPLHVKALVGPFTWAKYTNCPLGQLQNAGVLKSEPTVPGGSSCWTLSMSVRVASVPPQTRLASAVWPPMLVVLTT